MAAVSKIEDGVVELHTDVGRLYVCPTGWQRLYLRWTFRNFHSLPREILNARQKRLIDYLCRSALVGPAERVPSSTVIGIVENVKVLPLPSTGEAAEPAKAAPAVAQQRLPVLQARGENDLQSEAPRSLSQLSPPETCQPHLTLNGSANLPATTADEDTPFVEERVERRSDLTNTRRPWAIAAVSCAALTVLLLAIYLPRERGVPHPESTPLRAPAPPPIVVQQKPVPAPSPAGQKPEAERESAKPKTFTGFEIAASRRSQAKAGLSVPLPKPVDAFAASASLPVIAEAPRSGFIYPVVPNPNLVGKVVLKAVVGSDGAVKQVEVVSGERALAAAAARAVKQWRYAPPQVEGRTVEAQTQVTISFLGDDAISIILPQPK